MTINISDSLRLFRNLGKKVRAWLAKSCAPVQTYLLRMLSEVKRLQIESSVKQCDC
jgi:hypothetical protein